MNRRLFNDIIAETANNINSYLRSTIDDAELDIVMFIIACTIQRGKVSELITMIDFTHGFYEDNKIVAYMSRFKEYQINEALDGLEKKGFIDIVVDSNNPDNMYITLRFDNIVNFKHTEVTDKQEESSH